MTSVRVTAPIFLATVLATAVPLAGPQVARSGGQTPWPGDRFDVLEKSIPELQDAMQSGVVTSRDLVEIYLARIEAYDRQGPRLNAIVALNPRAIDDATSLDQERAARGPRGPLHGIPVVIKDNFDIAGLPTTAGTLALANLYPPDDAFQVTKLREAGVVILAKTNMHELASGITTIGSFAGQTRNPYDLARNPGGSSGGTGAAVAANLAAGGLGSDTCGSIRIPASHNALVGLRGTFGLASRDGVVPLSHTQDVAGPLARTVTDLAILLDATVGADPADDTTPRSAGRIPKSYRDGLRADALKGARIGILRSMFGDAPEDNEGGAVVRRALDEMKKLGAETIDAVVPGLDDLLRDSGVIDAEFKGDLAAYLASVPDAPVRSLGEILDRGLIHLAVEASARRRNAAEGVDSDRYRRALIKRATVRQAVLAVLDEHRLDALAYPTMRRQPARIDEPQRGSTCQLSASTGLPALSVPAGYTNDALPIGLELLGREFDEARLLALGYAFEQATRVRRPPFSAPALAGRRAPAPLRFATNINAIGEALSVQFTFDEVTGHLTYDATVKETRAADVLAAWIHRARESERGGAVLRVLGRGDLRRTGSFMLPPSLHAPLREKRLYLAFYTRRSAMGDSRAPLVLPAATAGQSVSGGSAR